jgi:hypothetical protein
MSFAQTVALGALAGFTIFIGLPVGRLQLLSSRARVALAMFSVGVLAFIFVDVMSQGLSIVDDALTAFKDDKQTLGYVIWLVILLAAGFTAGSAGLAMLERRLGDVKPSWGWIGLAGLIGGGPTFLGSIVGYSVTSAPLELAFYATAGGAILYVIGEIWNGMRRYGYRELGLLMVSAGFLVGVITDLIVTYGGG